MTQLRWTGKHLESLPLNEGKRYEIIDGELYVTTQPSFEHQSVCLRADSALVVWDITSQLLAPGIIFPDDDDVAPDLVWVSRERLPGLLGPDRKLHAAPDLVMEVLSLEPDNERRDREVKLRLYSQRGVKEYWIVDWENRQMETYRRENAALALVATLTDADTIQSPLLSGFSLPVRDLFVDLTLV